MAISRRLALAAFLLASPRVWAQGQSLPPMQTVLGATTCPSTLNLTIVDAAGTLACSGSKATYTAGGTGGLSNPVTAAQGGTGINTSASTGVPTISSGTWSTASALAAARGGTGIDTSASSGVPTLSSGTWSVSSTGLQAAYNVGGAGPQLIQEDSTRLGIQIRDASAALGVALFSVAPFGGASTFFQADASGTQTTGAHTVSTNLSCNGNFTAGNNAAVDTATFSSVITNATLSFQKEAAHTFNIAASTTATTVGGALSVLSGNGNSAAAGALTLDSGTGSAGGAVNVGATNAASVSIGSSGITTTNNGALAVNGNTTLGDAAADTSTINGSLTLTQGVNTSGSPTALLLTGGAHTTLAASTEASDVNWNLARTVQFATGAITTQRAMLIQAPTYGFVGASTITTAATLAISGAPVAGANATLTNSYALWVQGGKSVIAGPLWVSPAATAGAATQNFVVFGAADTNRTASTAMPMVLFDGDRTVEWATGAITSQYEIQVNAPTYAFVGASTITNAATLSISGAPAVGANATITNNMALRVGAGAVNLGEKTVSQATNINTNVTVNGASVVITTQSASTGTRAAESGFTVTNNAVLAASVVICTVTDYSGTYFTNGVPTVFVTSVSAGSFAVQVANTDATNALSGTMKIRCVAL